MTLALLAAAVGLSALGCDRETILEATDPDIVLPPNLDGVEALPTLRAATIGDVAQAYSGSGGTNSIEGIIMMSGLLSDELLNSETFPTRIEVDRRNIQYTNATVTGWFRSLMRARATAELAIGKFRQFSPDTTADAGFPELLALSGFTYLFFAENWCSGVPFSTVVASDNLVFGQPLTTAEMYDSAMSRFDEALAAANALGTSVSATTKTARINLARVGRGRVLLDRALVPADFAAAAAAVAGVPTSFVYLFGHSENTGRQNNGVFLWNVINERYSVANREGNNNNGVGLPYRSDADPRVQFARAGGTDVGFDQITPQFDQRRYIDRRASVPLASGLEVRLIEAEDRLQAGVLTGAGSYEAIHTALRAAPPSYILGNNLPIPAMGALSTTGLTAAQVVDQHFKERAYWLWVTAHRLSDMRRLMRQYGRAESALFPTGPYFKQNLQYDGADVSFLVPFDEENNPNFTQCVTNVP